MKFHFVYILRSVRHDFVYVGYSENLKARYKSHNNGENLSTKGKTTLKTMLKVYFEEKKL